MLTRLALALQNGELQGIEGIGGQGFGGGGGTIVVDENCSVRFVAVKVMAYANSVNSRLCNWGSTATMLTM